MCNPVTINNTFIGKNVVVSTSSRQSPLTNCVNPRGSYHHLRPPAVISRDGNECPRKLKFHNNQPSSRLEIGTTTQRTLEMGSLFSIDS